MNLKYYVSPYDLLEEGTGAPIILNENNGMFSVQGFSSHGSDFVPAKFGPCRGFGEGRGKVE